MAKGGFRGGMGGGNMMKQAQKMQEEFMKMQQELEQGVHLHCRRRRSQGDHDRHTRTQEH